MDNGPTLQEVCEEVVDCVNRTAPEDPRGEFYVIGTPAMRGNTINLREARRVTKDVFDRWTRRLLPRAGDLLLAREAPVGPVVRVPDGGNFAAGQRTTHLRANPEKVDPRFLYYLLASSAVQQRILAGAMGSTVPHLRVADVKSLRLPLLPALGTQRAVADVLGALDDKIAANERVVVVGEQLVQELVGRVGDRVALEELATRSKQSTKPDPAEQVNHFSLPAFDDGQSPSSERGEDIKSSKFLLNSPCVLMSKLNPRISRVWNVSELPEGTCIASTEFVVLVPQVVSTHALWATLTHPRVRDELMGRVAGTSGSHQRVKPEEILALDVTDVRSLSDTSRDQVDAVGALGHQLRVESRTLAQTRDQLLPLLMSGKVTIKEAENEIADLV
ncbi:UNVERIFIED_ORG: type I restriction enzyme S subunit [Gordonia westfalica J30]